MVAVYRATMPSREASPMAQPLSVGGIAMAKLVCHVVGLEATGAVGLRTHLARSAWLACLAPLPPRRRGMAACGRAHDWARWVRAPGHEVRWIAPPCLQADVKS